MIKDAPRAGRDWVLAVQDPKTGAKVEADLYVTRKGATPAAPGQMGLIPGSMGAPLPLLASITHLWAQL
jgi:RNA-splicing ligase RtcB